MAAGSCGVYLFYESAHEDETAATYAVPGREHLASRALSLSFVDTTGCCVYKAAVISPLSQETRTS